MRVSLLEFRLQPDQPEGWTPTERNLWPSLVLEGVLVRTTL